VYVDIHKDLKLNDLFPVANNLGIHEKQSTLAFFLKNLWECYKQKDAHRILINPLIYASDNRFYVGNCQIKVDDCSIFR
jgi:succinyl-CoA synthetase beta subunit